MKPLKLLLIMFFIPLLSFASGNNKEKFKLYYFEKDYRSFGVKDTIDPEENSTVLYFTEQDILELKKQLPLEVFKSLDIRDEIGGVYKYKNFMLNLLEIRVGKAKSESYKAIIEANSRKTTEKIIIKEKTDFLLKAINTEQHVGDPIYFVTLKSIPDIPQTLQSIFKNHPLFYIIEPQSCFGKPDKHAIGSIYKGEITDAENMINVAYNSVKEHTPLSLEERFTGLLFLLNGFDAQITINSIEKISKQRYSHIINTTINGSSKYYMVRFMYDAIDSIQELLSNKKPIWGKSFNY